MAKVDIIVPIYNAYEYTIECIESVKKNTNLIENRLILINDKSPDSRISSMLKEYEAENIIVIENEENLGFVKTVNKGMMFSKENDVILLNSDTEVTKNWLEKMKECAYSNEYIATVTPFTNNGTLCSIPNFLEDNELPSNMTLDEYADLVERCSDKKFPQLSTANGFCMYIKRSALEEVGFFDAETFEKGYGEENDFCYRALNYGYTNNLCDNTFIYHKGSQSFTKENLTVTRAQVIEDHIKKLDNKHPIYVWKNDAFLNKNPLKDMQERIKLNIELYNKKKILYLVNDWNENKISSSGTACHITDIMSGIEDDSAFLVLAPSSINKAILKLYLYTKNISKEIFSFDTELDLYNQFPYTNVSYKKIVSKIIDVFDIDILHVHHFLYQTYDIIDVAKEKNIYSILTLHDFYMLCPTINMVKDGKYCGGDCNIEKCRKCYKEKMQMNYVTIENWRRNAEKTISKFDKVIVPSENTKKIFSEFYKTINFEVIEHGVNVVNVSPNTIEKKYFDIAFVGVMAEHKGVRILEKLIEISKNSNIRIHLIGKSNGFEKVENSRDNYINHGAYIRGELPKKLVENNIDLVCIFTPWPETYSYTLSEVYMAKVPLLVYNIGAVGDRVTKDGLGDCMDINSTPEEIFEKINKISKDKKWQNEKKKKYESYKFKTIQDMQKEYVDIYNKIENKNTAVKLSELEYLNINKIKKEFEDGKNYIDRYQFLINRFEKKRQTKIWKLAKKIKSKIKK